MPTRPTRKRRGRRTPRHDYRPEVLAIDRTLDALHPLDHWQAKEVLRLVCHLRGIHDLKAAI